MFVTLRCGREEGDEIQCIERTTRSPYRGDESSTACNSCRRKKACLLSVATFAVLHSMLTFLQLRCSREKSGCRCCRVRGIECIYTTKRLSGGKKRRLHRPNPEIGNAIKSGDPFLSAISQGIEMQSPSAREIPVARYAVDSPSSRGSLFSGIQGRDSEQLIPSAEEGQGGDATPQPIPDQQVDDTSMNGVPGTRLSSEREELTALGMPSTGSYQDALSDDYFSRILESLDASHNVNIPGQTTGTVIDCHSPPLLGVPRQLTCNTVGGEHEQIGLDSDIVTSHSQFRPLRTQMALSNSVFSSRPPTQGVSTSSTLFSSGSDWTSPSSSGASSIPVRDSCKCTGTALRILEAVAMPVKAGDWSTREQGLYFLKGNIWQCYILSQCTSCRQESGFTILMLILCEKITGIFEEVAAG